jgi:hypothetical protein
MSLLVTKNSALTTPRTLRGILLNAVACLCLPLLWLCMLTTPTHAQFGMMNNAQMVQDVVTRRGLAAYGRLLNFDEVQTEAAKALLETTQAATTALQKELAEKMKQLGEKAREDGDFSLFQKEMPAMVKDAAERGEKLEKSFFDDLKALCSDEQLANWDAVDRYRRREKAMRFAFVSGSAVDLVAVVERTKVKGTNEADFKDGLLRYEGEVDKLLQEFERIGKESQKDMYDGAMFDMSRIEPMMRKFYDSAAQVRDVNRKHARQLAELMSEEDRLKFDAEVQRRSFPRIYRPSRPQTMLTSAMGFADLTAEQREQLDAIKQAYGRDALPINERWSKATEEKEEKAGGSVMVMIQGFQGQNDPNDPVREQREARKELDKTTADRIKAILTKEQIARLPEVKSEGFNPMADFMVTEDDEEPEAGADK